MMQGPLVRSMQGNGEYEEDWEIQVSVPRTLPTHEEEYKLFKDKWEEKRPKVAGETLRTECSSRSISST
eukprot:9837750-Prorocentrum_lima.AAC.1